MKYRLVGGKLITENGIEKKDLLIANDVSNMLCDIYSKKQTDCLEKCPSI